MKNKSLSSRQSAVLFTLLLITVLLGKFVADQFKRHRDLQNQLLAITKKQCQFAEKQKLVQADTGHFSESAAHLRDYEKSIPLADGYVHVSRIMMDAVPKVPLVIDPPETSQDLVSAPEYCSGLFRVRGSGRMDDLLAILQKTERDLPFSRVQDLQIVFVETNDFKVEFAFSLLTVMRMTEEFASIEATPDQK